MTPTEKPAEDPWLLTPGPLTTSRTVKEAMLHDYGSRDQRFIDINRHVRARLVEIIEGQGSHVCIPLQGSGTFVVEAMLSNFVPSSGKVLILINGAYGARMQAICEYHRLQSEVLQWPEDKPVDPGQVAECLAEDSGNTHVAVDH